MRIGWAKLTMSMEIDFNNAENGFGEERPMIFKSLLDRGHSLKLLTNLKKDDRKLLERIKTGIVDKQLVDNSWMQNIEYEPHGDAKDCSVLVIENGPLNMTFMDSYTEQPHIRKVVDIINSFEGLVIFYQSDPLLPFPFWRLTMAERPWSHPDNNVRNKRPAVEADGWADYDEIFKNKKIVCLGKSVKGIDDPDAYPNSMDSDRFKYDYFHKENLISFDFMPTGYDLYFIPHIKKLPDQFDDKLFPLIYIGFPRSRVSYFKNLYGRNLHRTHTYGPWDADEIRKEVLLKFKDQGMKWYGYVKGFTEITQAYSEAKCCFNLIPRKGQELGWISNRLFESVFCGCITFGDKETYGIGNYIPEELILDETNCDIKIEEIVNCNKNEYYDIWYKQYSKIKHLDYQFIIQEFETLIGKHLTKTSKILTNEV